MFSMFLQGLPAEDAQLVYQRAPDDLKRWGYDVLQELFRNVMDGNENTPGFDESFAEPEGMEAFRLERQRILDDENRPRGLQGVEGQ